MCLLVIGIHCHACYKLVLAANRDEYYDRPTGQACFWEEAPSLLAGRDLRAGGTWLGVTKKGRIAAITNFRDPASHKEGAPSRGELVSGFLKGRESPLDYLERVDKRREAYNGFNLVLGEGERLFWYSNRGEGPRRLGPGIYGVSNHLLDTSWPKVERGKEALARLLASKERPSAEAFFGMLQDRTIPPDRLLPETGIGLEWERVLSPLFIKSPYYGTRSSTVILVDQEDRVAFEERTFNGNPDEPRCVRYEFRLDPQTG